MSGVDRLTKPIVTDTDVVVHSLSPNSEIVRVLPGAIVRVRL